MAEEENWYDGTPDVGDIVVYRSIWGFTARPATGENTQKSIYVERWTTSQSGSSMRVPRGRILCVTPNPLGTRLS